MTEVMATGVLNVSVSEAQRKQDNRRRTEIRGAPIYYQLQPENRVRISWSGVTATVKMNTRTELGKWYLNHEMWAAMGKPATKDIQSITRWQYSVLPKRRSSRRGDETCPRNGRNERRDRNM